MIDWKKERSGNNYCGWCTHSPPSNSCNGDCFKEGADNFKENRTDHIAEMVKHHKSKLMDYEFDKSSWGSFHDCIFNAAHESNGAEVSLSQEELESLFLELPDYLQYQAFMWGMGDTPWRDEVFEWYQENKML